MELAFRLVVGIGIGFLTVLSVFGCAATAPPSEHLATSPPVAVLQARTPASGAAEEIDPDCPYLTVQITTPSHGNDADERRVERELQKPYMEKFSAHLKRVGFTAWEPLGARLKRAGFEELGAWWARIWPLLTDEGRWLIPGLETAELEKVMAKLAPEDRARVEQIEEDYENATWDVEMKVVDYGESEQIVGAVKGDRIIVWSLTMNKRPTVLDGALRKDGFQYPSDRNPLRRVGGIHHTGMMEKSKFGTKAAELTDLAAALFLPHARQLCADINATLLEEEAKLERIRDQLTEEIIRVRERRVEQEKRLKLEVEQ